MVRYALIAVLAAGCGSTDEGPCVAGETNSLGMECCNLPPLTAADCPEGWGFVISEWVDPWCENPSDPMERLHRGFYPSGALAGENDTREGGRLLVCEDGAEWGEVD